MADRFSFRDNRLGFVLDSGGSSRGETFYVFYHQVAALATGEGVDPAHLLGQVLAHELGHILLGTKTHSAWGIMRARFTGRTLQRAGQGALLFTRKQSEQIQAGVAARLRGMVPEGVDSTLIGARHSSSPQPH
ncbi:MAG: hypothetical protein ACE5JX_17045 [Acidobacteriota bacterium]